jgi:hypothetical protein
VQDGVLFYIAFKSEKSEYEKAKGEPSTNTSGSRSRITREKGKD